MTTEPRTTEPAGGDGLLFIISATIILVVGIESVFIAYNTWWLMGAVLVLVVVAAIGVCSALVRLIDDDTPVVTLQRRSEPELAQARAANPAAARPARWPQTVPAVRPLPPG
jgi:membrane protein implicated in regulation of membrane protease activity